jgi:hypothetical protein
MTKHASRRSHVQADKPAVPAPPAASEPAARPDSPLSAPPAATSPAPRLAWGWRLALFLWLTSFVFLLIYELLIALFRAL